MAIRDNHSNQAVRRALTPTAISGNGTTNGAIIDTADFDMGVKFAFDVSAYTDGSHAVSFEEGDASNLSDAAAVPSDKVLGGALTLSAVSSGNLKSRGLIGTKRYVRCVITSTGVTTGATIGGVAVLGAEVSPVVQ